MTDSTVNLGDEALTSLGSNVVMAVLGFLGVVIFARELSPAGFGAYYLLLAIAQAVREFSSSIAAAINKRISEHGVTASPFHGIGILVHLGYTIVLGVSLYVLAPVIPIDVVTPTNTLYISAVIFTTGAFMVTNKVLNGKGNPGLARVNDAVRSVSTFALQVGLLYAGYGFTGLLVGLSISSFLSFVGTVWYFDLWPSFPTTETISRTYEFAKWSVPNGLLTVVYQRFDAILIGVVASSTVVGYYEASMRLVIPATMLASSISGPLVVQTSALNSAGKSFKTDFTNAKRYVSLFSFPVFFGAVVIGEPLLRTMYGPEYVTAYPFLVGIAFFYILTGMYYPYNAVFMGVDKPDKMLYVKIIMVASYLTVCALLIPKYGAIGVVGATFVGELLKYAIAHYWVSSYVEVPIVTRSEASQFVSGGVMAIVVGAFNHVYAITGWMTLFTTLVLGAGVYFLCVTGLSPNFRAAVYSVTERNNPL